MVLDTTPALLAIERQVFGPEHPTTLLTKHCISVALSCQMKYDEALLIARECHASYIEVCGPEHPETLGVAGQVAVVLIDLGQHAESETILRETLVLQHKVVGAEHEGTILSANRLQTLIDDGKASIQTMP